MVCPWWVAAFEPFCGFSGSLSPKCLHSDSLHAHAEVEESLEVVTGGHQRPFKAGFFLAAQQEAPEADGLLDDAKDGLHGFLAQAIELSACGCV